LKSSTTVGEDVKKGLGEKDSFDDIYKSSKLRTTSVKEGKMLNFL
jgi:hypothetical protein